MTAESIRQALEGAHAYLGDHPDEARYTDSAAVAVVTEGLRVRVTGASGEQLETDMPASVGGGASAPSPGWFLRAAEASCVATLITMRAAQLGIELERVVVSVDSESDDRGILGISDEVPAGPMSTRVAVRLQASSTSHPAGDADLDAIARWALDHCPVTDAVRRAVPIALELEQD